MGLLFLAAFLLDGLNVGLANPAWLRPSVGHELSIEDIAQSKPNAAHGASLHCVLTDLKRSAIREPGVGAASRGSG